jgi:sodium transport system permease protein
MTETLRDRRTLIAAVILPAVTMPLVILVAPALLQRQQQVWQQRPVRIAVDGGAARTLADAAARRVSISIRQPTDPVAAVLRGDVDTVLVALDLPGGGLGLVIQYDESRPASTAGARRLAEALRDLRLDGVPPQGGPPGPQAAPRTPQEVVPVVTLENLATPERMGAALLASVLPLFIAVWLLMGGQYAALDVGVGERERGTLESLLAAPASRSALVGGKFLAVLGPALLALCVVLAAGAGALAAGGLLMPAGPVKVVLPLSVLLQMGLVGAALGSFLSAAQLIVSLSARTLREAQQAFTGLYLLVALPSMMVPLVGEGLDGPWMPYVPVVNGVWAIQRLLAGDPGPWVLGPTVAVLLAVTALILGLCALLLAGQARSIRR